MNYQQLQEENQPPKNFNPDTIPPNYDLARNHRLAQSVGNPLTDQSQAQVLCPCCSREVYRTELPVCTQIKKFGFLGSGYPLYFDFLQQCILILLILFATTADYNIFTNYYYGTDCTTSSKQDTSSTSTSVCIKSAASIFSLANKRTNGELMKINSMLNCVSIVAVLIFIHLFRKS